MTDQLPSLLDVKIGSIQYLASLVVAAATGVSSVLLWLWNRARKSAQEDVDVGVDLRNELRKDLAAQRELTAALQLQVKELFDANLELRRENHALQTSVSYLTTCNENLKTQLADVSARMQEFEEFLRSSPGLPVNQLSSFKNKGRV